MNDDFFMSWHPFIELGKIVRDHYRHVIFSIGCQKMVQSQCGTYSIPVRGNMCHYYKNFRLSRRTSWLSEFSLRE